MHNPMAFTVGCAKQHKLCGMARNHRRAILCATVIGTVTTAGVAE
jgi:hypothetical protein